MVLVTLTKVVPWRAHLELGLGLPAPSNVSDSQGSGALNAQEMQTAKQRKKTNPSRKSHFSTLCKIPPTVALSAESCFSLASSLPVYDALVPVIHSLSFSPKLGDSLACPYTAKSPTSYLPSPPQHLPHACITQASSATCAPVQLLPHSNARPLCLPSHHDHSEFVFCVPHQVLFLAPSWQSARFIMKTQSLAIWSSSGCLDSQFPCDTSEMVSGTTVIP